MARLSYAIGVAEPMALFLQTCGAEQGKLSAEGVTDVLKIVFDFRRGTTAMSRALRELEYRGTAARRRVGRAPLTREWQCWSRLRG